MKFKNETEKDISIKIDGEWAIISVGDVVEIGETVAISNGLTKVVTKKKVIKTKK